MKNKFWKILAFNGALLFLCNFLFSSKHLGLFISRFNPMEIALCFAAAAAVAALAIGGNYLIFRKRTKVILPQKGEKCTPRDYVKVLNSCKRKKELSVPISALISQIDRMGQKTSCVEAVLAQRFEKTEMTYNKFFTTINETNRVFFSNVRRAVNTIAVFDEQEYRDLRANRLYLSDESREVKNRLYNEYLSTVHLVIQKNEEIITMLDNLLLEMAKLNEGRDVQSEQILEDMLLLIRQTKLYA